MTTPPPTITVYDYRASTGEYIGSGTARQSPKDAPGVYLMPANSTTITPPSPVSGKAVIFSSGAWSLVDDNRGTTYYDTNGDVQTIPIPGADPDPSWTTSPPAPSAASLLATFQNSVSTLLAKSDVVMLRVQEAITLGTTTATAADVVAYVTYRRTLRDLKLATSPTTVPSAPPYPEGT